VATLRLAAAAAVEGRGEWAVDPDYPAALGLALAAGGSQAEAADAFGRGWTRAVHAVGAPRLTPRGAHMLWGIPLW
jgi:hypothetical protein